MSTQTGRTERSQVHQWARWYAEQAWSVVPVAPGKKRPGLEWAGHQATRATLEQIDAWCTDLYAQYGVGIITGAISGLVVIDVDEGPGKAGGDELAKLQLKHGDLPETPTVRTGGGGRHLYFKHPGRDADGNPIRIKTGKDVLAPGIDVRGDGGMVVAPPTVHPNGRPYEWIEGHRLGEFPAPDMPDWLIDLCCADVEPRTPGTAGENPVTRTAGARPTGSKRGLRVQRLRSSPRRSRGLHEAPGVGARARGVPALPDQADRQVRAAMAAADVRRLLGDL